MKAFWTWTPAWSGRDFKSRPNGRRHDSNRWFFDKSVWQRMFRTMSGCGFDTMVLASSDPFLYLTDLQSRPSERGIDESTLAAYREMHHWILSAALDYEIAPYIELPVASLSADYAHNCVRAMLETHPEIVGIFADVSQIPPDEFQQAVVDAVDAARPDAQLYVRGWSGDPHDLAALQRHSGRPVRFSVSYTSDHLVDANPDPRFTLWVEAAGAENVAAEFRFCNFEPWTSFSYETVEGILANLREIGCGGFSLHPLSPCEWPLTSDTFFKYQFQRDLLWYSVWGGAGIGKLLAAGTPKWLLRNQNLLPGFEAASRIMELLGLYFAGDRTSRWRPQFCSIGDSDCPSGRLLSVEDMLHLTEQPAFSGSSWWREVTGDRVVHLAEYLVSGTPPDAYGPEELIEELADLAAQAVEAGEKGMRRASGEKELPSFARDAFCMGRLGEFYIERLRASLTHGRGDDAGALEHMARALGVYREIRAVDNSHRGPWRAAIGDVTVAGDWLDTIRALEAEYADAANGEFKSGTVYPVHRVNGADWEESGA